MSSKYNLKIGNIIVPVKSIGIPNLIIDNVLIKGDFSNLPILAKLYIIQNLFKSKGLANLVEMIDKNDPVANSCPKDLVEFIKEFIAVLRGFSVPDIHNQFQFTRSLKFCLACPKLMKKSDQGCQFIMPFTTVRAFYKADNYIKMMFNDIIRCAFGFTSTSSKTYPIEVMFGKGLADMTDLSKACYEATGVPLPNK